MRAIRGEREDTSGLRGAGTAIDRWLFYFEGRAVGGETGDAPAPVRYLEAAAATPESAPAAELAAFEARLEALRRALRWWGLGVLAVLACTLALVLALGLGARPA